jgi:hypothetical protein
MHTAFSGKRVFFLGGEAGFSASGAIFAAYFLIVRQWGGMICNDLRFHFCDLRFLIVLDESESSPRLKSFARQFRAAPLGLSNFNRSLSQDSILIT